MKEKTKYILTIVVTCAISVIATLYTLNEFGLFEERIVEVDRTVKNVNITESDSIKESVDKIYNAVVYIESSKNNKSIGSGSGFVYKIRKKKISKGAC